MKRHLLAFFLACATLAACADATNAIPWRVERYSLLARQMALREAFDTFGVTEGLSVVMSEQVQGAFSGDFVDMPAQEFLERVCTMHNLTWYYDGAALYICTAGEVESQLVDLTYMKAGDVRAMLRELGVEDRRFPIKTANNDELIMVSGPPRYVQLVLTTIEKADRLKQLRTFNEIETRIFPLVNTWADSVSFRSSDPESGAQIRGVASILQELMAGGRNNQSREATTNRADTADSKMQDAINGNVSPIIRPDNRLNAVIVRDVSTRMPMYEELIRQLDVPQRLVEIGVTVVEMTRDDSLDWQLSLAVRGAHSDFEGAAGQNAGNLFAPAALAGRGLAGALTYLGDHVQVSTSLSALRTKGKARNISRTSILTTDNIAAEITDMQSYHARVVGTEVASLEEVTAGTKLSIKPRIMSAAATNEAAPEHAPDAGLRAGRRVAAPRGLLPRRARGGGLGNPVAARHPVDRMALRRALRAEGDHPAPLHHHTARHHGRAGLRRHARAVRAPPRHPPRGDARARLRRRPRAARGARGAPGGAGQDPHRGARGPHEEVQEGARPARGRARDAPRGRP